MSAILHSPFITCAEPIQECQHGKLLKCWLDFPREYVLYCEELSLLITSTRGMAKRFSVEETTNLVLDDSQESLEQ